MKRNDIRIRGEFYSRSSINKFKDFDRLARAHRRNKLKSRAKKIAFLIIGLLAVSLIVYYQYFK